MKLRNKKTGEAVYVDFQIPLCNNNEVLGCYSVTSLKELNNSFEDWTPAEPLIKDEKIRKAVRAWAEANTYDQLFYDKGKDCLHSPYGSDDTDKSVRISFSECDVFEKLGHRELYSIAELCGEEE